MTIHPTFTAPYDPAFDNPLTGQARPTVPQSYVSPTSQWARMSNEDRLTRVRELNAADMSPAEIAIELEATTSAIRSVAFRAGLRLSGTIAVPRRGPPMVAVDDVPAETWMALGPSVGLIENTGCRWPVGLEAGSAQKFCGADRAGRGSYCATHGKMGRL